MKAFISPNAVYFTAVFVVSTVLMIPALPETAIAAFLCLTAVTLLGHQAYARSHLPVRDQKVPFDDWLSYFVLPISGYVLLLLAGVCFWLQAAFAAHVTAVALILLLVVGIRNAWDLVIWIARQEHDPDSRSPSR